MKHLEHLSIINIAGEDADEFLQGQMTQDTQSINDGLFHLTSFCNVQGRVISTALIHRSEDLFRLILNIDLRDELSNHLQKYILRSKVNIQTSEELIFGINQKDIRNSEEEEYITLSNDPQRSVFISNKPPEDVDQTISTNDWIECDINSMIPMISKDSSLQYIPQMLNLDELKGVSFSKGCYTGQEVVARVQHRGKVKKRMYKINIKETDSVDPHTQIMDQTKPVGNIVISKKIANDCICLAVINQVDSTSELTVNEKSIELL